MTRDEAIVKFVRLKSASGTRWIDTAPGWIDTFVGLGMLKLDEPKSAQEQLAESVVARIHPASVQIFFDAMDKLGLKLVEK